MAWHQALPRKSGAAGVQRPAACRPHTAPLQDGTPAAQLPEQVAPAMRQRRRDELVSIQQRISEGFAASLVGSTLDVLVDAIDEDGGFIGRTQWDAPDGGLAAVSHA
jgi:hypothetical protein